MILRRGLLHGTPGSIVREILPARPQILILPVHSHALYWYQSLSNARDLMKIPVRNLFHADHGMPNRAPDLPDVLNVYAELLSKIYHQQIRKMHAQKSRCSPLGCDVIATAL